MSPVTPLSHLYPDVSIALLPVEIRLSNSNNCNMCLFYFYFLITSIFLVPKAEGPFQQICRRE